MLQLTKVNKNSTARRA